MKSIYHSLRTTCLASALLLGCTMVLAEDEHGHDLEAESHEGHDESGHSDEVTISPEAMKIFSITIEPATRRVLTDTGTVPARVAYNGEAMAHVGVPVAGRASEILVKLGDTVAKGDLLAVVESPELGQAESNLLQTRSLMAASEGAVEVARIAFQRAEELRKTNTVSVTEFLERQGELKKAEGDLKVAEASHQAAENHLHILGLSEKQVEQLIATGEVSSRFELRAPIAGTIVQREVTPGEVVGPDREPLMIIADLSTLWVLADVPERVAHRVVPGSKGRIILGFADNAEIEGVVDYVAPEMNPRTRTAQVRLVVNAHEKAVVHTGHEEETTHDSHEGHDHAHDEAATVHDEHSAEENDDDHAGHDHESEAEHTDHDGHDHAEHAGEHDEGEQHHDLQHEASPDAGSILKPGMFAEVELELIASGSITSTPVLVVPEEAVQTVEGRDAVFVPADEVNTFTPRPVTIGRHVGGFVPVLSGLKEGDKYVATGSFILKAELAKGGVAHEH